jgi:hypothetical protein
MLRHDNFSYQEGRPESIDVAHNLALALLSNNLFCYSFPSIAYVLAVLLQTQLNDLVSIQYGASILYLSFGVRMFVALMFGVEGLLWMVFGQLFIFSFFPTPYYNDHPVESFLLSCSYSVIAYVAVRLVQKLRHIDSSFSSVRTVDIALIAFIGALVASLAHKAVLGDHFIDPVYSLLTSFLAKFIGSMIGFYGLILLFSLLQRIRITPKG